jgi:hypothetical protein
MAARSVRKTLPISGHPCLGTEFLLDVVARRRPSLSELGELIASRSPGNLPALFYRHGDDDILYFVEHCLALVERDNDSRLVLTNYGLFLHGYVFSDSFRAEFLRWAIDRSRKRFSYLAHVVDALVARSDTAGLGVSMTNYKTILDETNRRSGKEIRVLLRETGAVCEAEDRITINPMLVSMCRGQSDIVTAVRLVRQFVVLKGSSHYRDVMDYLGTIFDLETLSHMEYELRSHLRINATRTAEYVDGILDD